jgi:phosphatidylinositol phospholipase C delta
MSRVRGRSPSPAPSTSPRQTAPISTTSSTAAKLTSPGANKLSPTPAKVAPKPERRTVKMSLSLIAFLVYTVGVKCRGINKKEEYAPEHVFSLSENTANRYLKQAVIDLIKHSRAHLVRIYPKGLRLASTNYEPHRYWAAGAQLVAINWQTCGEASSQEFTCRSSNADLV